MKRYPIYFEVVGSVVFALLGIWVAGVVGLLDSASSAVMKMGLGGVSAYFFAANFWVALHR